MTTICPGDVTVPHAPMAMIHFQCRPTLTARHREFLASELPAQIHEQCRSRSSLQFKLNTIVERMGRQLCQSTLTRQDKSRI